MPCSIRETVEMFDHATADLNKHTAKFNVAERKRAPYTVVTLQECLLLKPVDISDLVNLPMSLAIQKHCYSHQSRFIVLNGMIDLSYESQRIACARNGVRYRVITREEMAVLLHHKGMPQASSFIPTTSGLIFFKNFEDAFPGVHGRRSEGVEHHGKKNAGVMVEDAYYPTIKDCADAYQVTRTVVYCMIKRHGYMLRKELFEKRKARTGAL